MKLSSDIDGVFSLDITIVSKNCSWGIPACNATMTPTFGEFGNDRERRLNAENHSRSARLVVLKAIATLSGAKVRNDVLFAGFLFAVSIVWLDLQAVVVLLVVTKLEALSPVCARAAAVALHWTSFLDFYFEYVIFQFAPFRRLLLDPFAAPSLLAFPLVIVNTLAGQDSGHGSGSGGSKSRG